LKYHNQKKFVNFLKFKKEFQSNQIDKLKIYHVIIFWLKNKLTRSQFLNLSGILVGITAGFAAVILKSLVHYIQHFITQKVQFTEKFLYYGVFPFLGIVLTAIVVKVFFKGQSRKGINAILSQIASNSSIIEPVKKYSQIIQSAITVGFGGSAGLESPIAVTGAAIGSNYAQTYKLTYRERTLLLAAGASAGIASAFNAPIAGVMFAFEILLVGVVFTDFIPLVVASVCGSLISRMVLNEDVLFYFQSRNAFDYHNTMYYVFLGVVSGFFARYYVLTTQFVEHKFKQFNFSWIQAALLGGSLLAVICVLFPPLFGEGYDFIKQLNMGETEAVIDNSVFKFFDSSKWVLFAFLAAVLLLKSFASSITINSGGNGGNFAPTLFAGGVLGYIYALGCTLLGFENVPTANLVLVGMAGVLSGAMYAPLTAIFLIAESSSGYDLFIPLMIVSVISYLMAKGYSNVPPEMKKLAEEGKVFTTDFDSNILSQLELKSFIDEQSLMVHKNDKTEVLYQVLSNSKKSHVAVLDSDEQLVGVISVHDVRSHLLEDHWYEKVEIYQLMSNVDFIVRDNQNVNACLKLMDQTDSWQMPCLTKDGKFLGFVYKNSILAAVRKRIQEFS